MDDSLCMLLERARNNAELNQLVMAVDHTGAGENLNFTTIAQIKARGADRCAGLNIHTRVSIASVQHSEVPRLAARAVCTNLPPVLKNASTGSETFAAKLLTKYQSSIGEGAARRTASRVDTTATAARVYEIHEKNVESGFSVMYLWTIIWRNYFLLRMAEVYGGQWNAAVGNVRNRAPRNAALNLYEQAVGDATGAGSIMIELTAADYLGYIGELRYLLSAAHNSLQPTVVPAGQVMGQRVIHLNNMQANVAVPWDFVVSDTIADVAAPGLGALAGAGVVEPFAPGAFVAGNLRADTAMSMLARELPSQGDIESAFLLVISCMFVAPLRGMCGGAPCNNRAYTGFGSLLLSGVVSVPLANTSLLMLRQALDFGGGVTRAQRAVNSLTAWAHGEGLVGLFVLWQALAISHSMSLHALALPTICVFGATPLDQLATVEVDGFAPGAVGNVFTAAVDVAPDSGLSVLLTAVSANLLKMVGVRLSTALASVSRDGLLRHAPYPLMDDEGLLVACMGHPIWLGPYFGAMLGGINCIGCITDWRERWMRMVGYSRHDVINFRFSISSVVTEEGILGIQAANGSESAFLVNAFHTAMGGQCFSVEARAEDRMDSASEATTNTNGELFLGILFALF